MIAAIGLAYLWEQRPTAGRRWSPLQLLGRSSLFIYWIHVELVYGMISHPLHGAFSLRGAWIGLPALLAADGRGGGLEGPGHEMVARGPGKPL